MTKFTHPDNAPKGHKWQTRNGEPVLGVSAVVVPEGWDGATLRAFVDGGIEPYFHDGLYTSGGIETQHDLFDAPVEQENWVNFYPDKACVPYSTRREADFCAGSTRIACVKVPWVEGQFDE